MMSSKATAAKSAAKAGTSVLLALQAPPAQEAAPVQEEGTVPAGGEAANKRKRVYSETEKSVHNAHTTMTRLASGKVKGATEEQVADAKYGLHVYKTLGKDDRLEFAKKVEGSKGNKNFSWTRNFTETLKASKKTTELVTENYYTRTLLCGC